jgi:hypothetical protein
MAVAPSVRRADAADSRSSPQIVRGRITRVRRTSTLWGFRWW